MDERAHFLDGKVSRGISLVLSILIFLIILFVWQKDFLPFLTDKVDVKKTSNKLLDDCLKRRLSAVENILKENSLTPEQSKRFKSRAIVFCEAQFGDKN